MTRLRFACLVLVAVCSIGCAAVVSYPDVRGDALGPADARADVVAIPDVPVLPDVVDIPVLPDVQGSNLPNGSPCGADAQCTSGICIRSPRLSGTCGVACTREVDCLVMGSGVHCALDRPASGPRWVCSTVEGSSALAGQDCTSDFECFSNACDGIACHGPCMADSECSPTFRCGAWAVAGGSVQACRFTPITGVSVEDFQLFDGTSVVDRGVSDRLIIVPPDVVSLTYIVQDMVGQELWAAIPRLEAPDGTLLIDGTRWNGITEQPTREIIYEHQVNAAYAPTNNTLRLAPGFYRASFSLVNDRTAMTSVNMRRMRVVLRIKRAPGGVVTSGTLHLRVFLVGTLAGGLTAATARSNARLQAAVATMTMMYAGAGIRLVVDNYADIGGADGTTYGTIDSRVELEQLFTRSSTTTGDVINIFMIRGISMAAGLGGAIGVAGDIGGPPGVQGTTHSGVVVSWETTFGGGRDLLPQTMAHECGHFLGLWHLVERVPGCTSPGQMDCAPFGGIDAITDTPNTMGASQPYLMNWFTDGTNNRVSPGQAQVLRYNPVVGQ